MKLALHNRAAQKWGVLMIIKSERIYMEDGVKDGYLEIRDGKFVNFSEEAPKEEWIDFGKDRVIPGIIDTHNHGTCGYAMMGDNPSEVKGYLKGCASQGVTGIFPTADIEMMEAVADEAMRQEAAKKYEGSKILGIHSEGPWLNRTGEKGIRRGWPEVKLEKAQEMVKRAKGYLKLVALAPEIPGMDEIISYFLSQGITVADAHSDCNYQEAMQAYGKGLTVATHTGNVMTGMHHRDIGGLGAALLNDKVDCEVICDGMHICLDMLKIYFKLKDFSRFMMISDCTQLSGAPVGSYQGFEPGMIINVTEEGFLLSDTGRLCGSSQPVLYGIGNLVEKLDIPMETVVKMAALNAATKYGFSKEKGSIKIGKDADFVVISDEYKALATYVEGQKVYDRAEEGDIFNPEFLDSLEPVGKE